MDDVDARRRASRCESMAISAKYENVAKWRNRSNQSAMAAKKMKARRLSCTGAACGNLRHLLGLRAHAMKES